MARPALLLRTEEALVLALPLVCLVFGLGELALGLPFPGGEGQRLTRFLVNVFFLNTLHIVFTFSMIAHLPELKSWARGKGGGRRWVFWAWVGVCLLLMWSFFVYAGAYFHVGEGRVHVATLLVLLGIVVPGFHNLWQNRGLSLAYHQTYELPANERTRAERRTRLEKNLFMVLFLSYSVQMLASYGWALPWEDQMPDLWVRLFESGSLVWIRGGSFAICLASSLALIGTSWTGPFHQRTRKTLFLGRLLLYPLSAFSYAALMGILATHGVEYWAVYRTMTVSSKAARGERVRTHASSLGLALLVLGSILPGYLLVPSNAPSFWVLALSAAGLAINYTHYVLDRVLFKMSDRPTREASGALLLGAFRGRRASSD